jgi:hypothetical protein
MDKLEQVAQRLQLATLAIKRLGFEIRRGGPSIRYLPGAGWDVLSVGVEPMGALLLHEQPHAEGLFITEHGEAARLLDVSVSWVLEFRAGFYTWTSCSIDRFPPYRLGAWFAQEYADDFVV